MNKEFTATAYIVKDNKVLLLYHAKHQKWLPPGGHIEPNETPVEAVKREVLEETGLGIEIIKQENVWVSEWNASSFERPYLCLLENIPAYKDRVEHQHMDFIYVARPNGKSVNSLPENCQWFSLEDLKRFKPDVEIFKETLDVLTHLFEVDNQVSSIHE